MTASVHSHQFDLQLFTRPRCDWLAILDARLRIIAAISFAFTSVALHTITAVSLAFCIALMAAWGYGLQLRYLAWRLFTLDSVLFALVITLPFTTAGKTLWEGAGFHASFDGLHRAGLIVFKANAIMTALLSFLGTLAPFIFGQALARLGVPSRLVQLLLFTTGQIYLLEREYQRLRQAMLVRGFQLRTNRHTWHSLGWLLAMLLIRGVQRAQRLLAAMRCRGFHGQFYLLNITHWQLHDSWWLVLWLGLMAVLMVLDRLLL
ncbi:energy-coupling factor transporter transmembrane component T family protein [Thiospirillum jenense]|uniref:energy-coupling factor transporter transmembrane component T family protein n=1 Tax=Thiospirillum jenense TaxID=1653858 RepID=UPI001EEBFB30|nr:energy-coupling factor transporter transmembrane component T [Thiospirillum jenense]